ncbi:MAG: transposase [Euryarchaeota archaeon]|nr:transposase [Euryarchaeota archaeon]
MKLVICSYKDKASINIADALCSLVEWNEEGEFRGYPIKWWDDFCMLSIDELHIYAERIDLEIEKSMEMNIDEIIFLSRHKSASGKPSLTAHPIGNWNRAEYGGEDRTLTPAAPDLMTSVLRQVNKEAEGLAHDVSFEVTHHGPLLSKPTMFLEIGSDEQSWEDKNLANTLAKSLLSLNIEKNMKIIGIGGGHYAPRFTDIALSRQVSFGHMLPTYAMDFSDTDSIRHNISLAMNASDTKIAYIHKKSIKRSEATIVSSLVQDLGGTVVSSSDLERIP